MAERVARRPTDTSISHLLDLSYFQIVTWQLNQLCVVLGSADATSKV